MERTGVAQVLLCSALDQQMKLRLRVTNESRWLHMVTLILREEKRAAWNSHVCRQYVLHEDRLVYTWNFVLQADDIERAVMDVCRVFDLICSNIDMFSATEERELKRPAKKSRPAAKSGRPVGHGELNEFPLVGAEGRHVPEVSWNQFRSPGRRKGAHPIGGDL